MTDKEVIEILKKICFVYIVDNPNEVDEIHEAKMRLIRAFESECKRNSANGLHE